MGALRLGQTASSEERSGSGSLPASWACCWCQSQLASQLPLAAGQTDAIQLALWANRLSI